ncbi:MAG: single-stranded DNA-binding protein [Actinomycetota bacterium]|nr:single-stranded DNA-binding protein [Actinomycetota bacterium]
MSNSVTVIGNITREPELRYTPSGAAVVKFGIAVNRSYANRNGDRVEQTDFFDVTAWRELGENIAESLSVGSRVIVTGRLQQDRWENDGGEKRSKVYIVADEVGPSLRWATAQVTKTTRGGPGEWPMQSPGSVEEQDQEVPTGA